jgi:hypothetical protein
MKDDLKRNKKWKTTSKQNENGRWPQLIFFKLEWQPQKRLDLKKNGRQPLTKWNGRQPKN